MSESEQDAGRETAAGRAQARREFERDRVTHWAVRIREETGWPWEVACQFSERQRDRLERVAIAAELAGGPVGDPLARVQVFLTTAEATARLRGSADGRFMPGGAPDIRHAPLWLSCVAARLADLAHELNRAELSDLAATLRDIGARCDVVPRGGEGS